MVIRKADKLMNQMAETKMLLKERRELAGKIAYSILSGVFGSILLVAFLTLFFDILGVVKFIPWIIAFNTAMTGYSLLDKTRDYLQHRHIFAIVAGSISVFITCGILSIMSAYFLGENIFRIWDFIFFLIIGMACSELGALLAIKYFKLGK
jgi:hypothetical protein